jgi:ABC-type sulfate transport system substrate-binding protein
MRVFDHPNMETKEKCPVCHTLADKPVTLVGKEGTQKGYNMEAIQVHVDCLDLLYYPEAQKVR